MEDMRQDIETKMRTRREALVVTLGYCAGFSSVFRFPSIAHEEGGTFIYLYLILTISIAYPMCFLEIALGQYVSHDPRNAFKFCPIAEGIGYSMAIYCLILPVSVVMYTAYAMFYMFTAFNAVMPWSTCSEQVIVVTFNKYVVTSLLSSTQSKKYMPCSDVASNSTQIPSVYYWITHIIDNKTWAQQSGDYHWFLAACLLLSWSLIFYTSYKGFHSGFQVLKITGPFSMVVILCFFIASLVQKHYKQSFLDFFTPTWDAFFNIQVWRLAAEQAFLSVGASAGPLITLGSFGHFRDQSLYKDALKFTLLPIIVSLLSGLLLALNITKMVDRYKAPITILIPKGVSFIFVVYPEMVREWWIPQIWTFVFFASLVLIGVNSVIAYMETFKLVIFTRIHYFSVHKSSWTLAICFINLLFNFMLCSKNGHIIATYMNTTVGGWPLLFIAAAELTAILCIYGRKTFYTDLEFMLDDPPHLMFRLSWTLSLCGSTVLLVWSKMRDTFWPKDDYKPSIIINGLLAFFVLLPTFLVAFSTCYKFHKKGNIKLSFQPRDDAGPKFEIWRTMRESFIGIEEQLLLD